MMVFEVSAPGKDVLTCQDYEKYYSSKYDTWKVKSVSTLTLNVPAHVGAITYTYDITAHGLGYVPAFEAFVQIADGSYVHLPFNDNSFSDLTNNVSQIEPYMDSTQPHFGVVYGGGAGTTLSIKLFVFYNQIE